MTPHAHTAAQILAATHPASQAHPGYNPVILVLVGVLLFGVAWMLRAGWWRLCRWAYYTGQTIRWFFQEVLMICLIAVGLGVGGVVLYYAFVVHHTVAR